MGNLTGAVLFVAFLKFPLIRQQPGFRRVGLSGVLAYPFYWYMHSLATKIKVKRSIILHYFSPVCLQKTTYPAQGTQESHHLIILNRINSKNQIINHQSINHYSSILYLAHELEFLLTQLFKVLYAIPSYFESF